MIDIGAWSLMSLSLTVEDVCLAEEVFMIVRKFKKMDVFYVFILNEALHKIAKICGFATTKTTSQCAIRGQLSAIAPIEQQM